MAESVRTSFVLTDLALSLVAAFGYIVRATSRDEAIRRACGASPGRLLRAHLHTGLLQTEPGRLLRSC